MKGPIVFMFRKLLILGGIASLSLIPNATMSTCAADEAAAPEAAAPAPEASAPVTQAAALAVVEDVVIARVNGQDIAQSELDSLINNMMMQKFREVQASNNGQAPMPDFQAMRDDVAAEAKNQIVSLVAFQQAIEKKKESLPKESVDALAAEISQMMLEQGVDKAQVLKENKMTEEDFRKDIQHRLAVESLVEELTGVKVMPTDEQITKFFDENVERLATPEQLTTSHILFAFPRDPANAAPSDEVKAELKKKAEETLEKITAGEDFGKLANEFSDCPSGKRDNGNLGANARGQMVPEFDDVAWGMKVGEMSGVVETPFGYHIIKVTDRTEAEAADYDKMKNGIREQLRNQNIGTHIEEAINKVIESAEVEILEVEKPTEDATAEVSPAETE